jgi:hypothetical protein
MAIDTQTLTQLITEFRSLTAKDSITPESLGSILQRIADLLATAGTSGDNYDSLKEIQSQIKTLQSIAVQSITDVKIAQNQNSAMAQIYRKSLTLVDQITSIQMLSAATTSQAGVMSAQQVTDLNSALTRCAKLESSVTSLKDLATKQISCRVVNNCLFISGATRFTDLGYVPYLFRLTSKRNRYHHRKRTEEDKDRKTCEPKTGWNLFGSKYMVKMLGEEVHFSALRHDLLCDQPLYYSTKPDILMWVSEDKKGNKRVAWGRSLVQLNDYKTGKPRMLRFRFAIGFGKDLPVNMHPITFANLACPPVEFSVIYSGYDKLWLFGK